MPVTKNVGVRPGYWQLLTPAQRRLFALRGVLVAGGILLFFVVFGNALLSIFGITLPALKTAGGLLLFLISVDMVFARHSGGTGTTSEEEAEAQTRPDISVFPLAMPLIASATATLLFRQVFLAVPDELVEAARMDGAGPLRFLRDILLPVSAANMAARRSMSPSMLRLPGAAISPAIFRPAWWAGSCSA